MTRFWTLATLACLGVFTVSTSADEPPSHAAPALVAWATFDIAELGVEDRTKKPRQMAIGSGAELLAAIRPDDNPEPAAIAAAERQLAKVLAVNSIDWEKHRVILRVGGYTRIGGDFRLDMRPSKADGVTAQWTFKENGTTRMWSPGAAALVERTNVEIGWEKFRLIDDHLNVDVRD